MVRSWSGPLEMTLPPTGRTTLPPGTLTVNWLKD
jgi:hypothetical protein